MDLIRTTIFSVPFTKYFMTVLVKCWPQGVLKKTFLKGYAPGNLHIPHPKALLSRWFSFSGGICDRSYRNTGLELVNSYKETDSIHIRPPTKIHFNKLRKVFLKKKTWLAFLDFIERQDKQPCPGITAFGSVILWPEIKGEFHDRFNHQGFKQGSRIATESLGNYRGYFHPSYPFIFCHL